MAEAPRTSWEVRTRGEEEIRTTREDKRRVLKGAKEIRTDVVASPADTFQIFNYCVRGNQAN
jgi:hypothetical protein